MDPRTEQQLTNEPAYTGDPTHPGDPVYGSDPTYQAEGQRSPEQLSSEIAHTRANLAGDLDALQDRVSPHAVMERRKAAARGGVHRMRDRVMGSAHGARSGASGAASSVGSTAQDAASTVEDKYDGSPLAAGLMAFGAGMVASALVSPSRKETEMARRLVDTAHEKGVVDEVKSVGQDMGQQLKEGAKEKAAEVQGTAQESAERVKAEGQNSAQSVKDDAQSGSTSAGTPPPPVPPGPPSGTTGPAGTPRTGI